MVEDLVADAHKEEPAKSDVLGDGIAQLAEGENIVDGREKQSQHHCFWVERQGAHCQGNTSLQGSHQPGKVELGIYPQQDVVRANEAAQVPFE